MVVVDFPRTLAKSFPGAVVLDRRLALRDDPPPAGRLAILAHEMVHLWWPNGMRVTGPGAGALQEGLAEYGSSRAVGDILGPAAEALCLARGGFSAIATSGRLCHGHKNSS